MNKELIKAYFDGLERGCSNSSIQVGLLPKFWEWGHPSYHAEGNYTNETEFNFTIYNGVKNDSISKYSYNWDTKELNEL
jgi:hypothetical protein